MPCLDRALRLALVAVPSLFLLAGCSGSNNSSTRPPVTAALTMSPSSLTFNSPALGQASAAQTVTLTNSSTAAVSISGIALSGPDSSPFAETTTCGASLAAGATCGISVTFKPTVAQSGYSATLNVTNNAPYTPRTLAVSLTGSLTAQATVTLSPTSLIFGASATGVATPAQTVAVTNTGGATLNNLSIALGGTNAAQFTDSTTCASTLAPGESCNILVAFTAAALHTPYSAALTLTDSASNSPQTVPLTGSAAADVSFMLETFPEIDSSISPLYALINGAERTIDMTMYALEDTIFTNDLIAGCKRGIVVRVILDQNNEKSANTAAFNALNAQANCTAVWANTAFEATHQKSIIIDAGFDDAQVAIMSLNLQSQYYATTRDFAMIENDPVDIAAIESTFLADYAAGTTASGAVGVSDFAYVPSIGTDLIWSPTTAQAAMVNIIANAKSTLLIENEELASSATGVITALENACKAGVQVKIAMVDNSDYESNFTAIDTACGAKVVHVYPDTTAGFYIHAKAVVADYGLPTQAVYMGSINYSNASMTQNRELGMYVTDPVSVIALNTTMLADYNGGTAF